jgi:hypothetical protein
VQFNVYGLIKKFEALKAEKKTEYQRIIIAAWSYFETPTF